MTRLVRKNNKINIALLAGSAIGMNQSGMNTQIDTIEEYFKDSAEFNVYKYDIWNYVQPDIIHYFGFGEGMIDVLRWSKEKGTKIICSPNYWPMKNWSEKILMKINFKNTIVSNRLTKRYLVDKADLFIVNSSGEKRKFIEFFKLPADRVSIIHNSYGMERQAYSETFLKKHSITEPYALMVGMLGPERKNHLRVLQSWKKDYPLLVIVGSYFNSPYGERCMAEIKSRPNVKYVGFENDPSVIDSAYQNCEFLISPGLIETPSLSALRALLYGKTVCSTNAEGVPNEYFKENAYYFDPFNEKEIVQAIDRAVTESIEVNEKEIFQYSDNTILEHYKEAYRDLLR